MFELRSWEVHWAECMCVVLCVKISRSQKVSAGANSHDARGKLNMRRRVSYVSALLDLAASSPKDIVKQSVDVELLG